MADTIEWLETIGKSAKLRHAPAEELTHTLEQADASDALKAAVIHGDGALLSAEFGHKPMHGENDTHTHPHPPHHPDKHKEEEEPAHHEDEPGQSEPNSH
jgi:enoyl-CoA hydratase/carnithine racemase